MQKHDIFVFLGCYEALKTYYFMEVRETDDFEQCVLACDSRYGHIGWLVSLRWLMTTGLLYWLDGLAVDSYNTCCLLKPLQLLKHFKVDIQATYHIS